MNPIRLFSAKELARATDGYNQNRFLGSGISLVYKGFLDDGRPVAVKTGVDGFFRMFVNEVVSLSRINHRNVVKLLGCCIETKTPFLVYEFVPNGTLYQRIHTVEAASRMTWPHRLRIAAQVADALNYLHTAHTTAIVHGNVQSSSIFLDENYSAKVGTFGFSELVSKKEMCASPDQRYGYADQLSEKRDVYGFGMMLIELLTGKEPCEGVEESVSSMWMDRLLLASDFEEGIVREGAEREQLVACARLAVRCITEGVEERPTMKEVVQELRRMMRPWHLCNTANANNEAVQVLRSIDS